MSGARLTRWMFLLLSLIALVGTAQAQQAECPATTVKTTLPIPALDPIQVGAMSVSGTIDQNATGTVQVCVDGVAQGAPQPIKDGKFTVAVTKLVVQQKVVAQFISTAGVYSHESAELTVESCSASIDKTVAIPSWEISSIDAKNTATYQGEVPSQKSGTVRICNGDLPVDGQTAAVGADGRFTGTKLPVSADEKLFAQFSSDGKNFGPLSKEVDIEAGRLQVAGLSHPLLSKIIVIGGVEESSFSTNGLNSNPFVEAYIEGPDRRLGRPTGWGRIRLTSAPQPSTQGIVSTFKDPTGQITTQDFSKVGQVLDVTLGPQVKISKYWSIIGDYGFTTPLDSQGIAETLAVPAGGTAECSELISRFQLAAAPPPTSGSPSPPPCLANGITDIAFANQDRSNFLSKYGFGFRTSNKFECKNLTASGTGCSPSSGVLDLTFGQDESVTKGRFVHAVFKMDGILPIPMGQTKAAYIYLFGSAYIRLAKNQNLAPLILQAASGGTPPSPTVAVLPLQIPDRDFFRLGVGLNVVQIFCKMFGSTCPNTSSSSTATPSGSRD